MPEKTMGLSAKGQKFGNFFACCTVGLSLYKRIGQGIFDFLLMIYKKVNYHKEFYR